MSAPTMTRSSYPVAVADLVPRAVELAAELGRVPSVNRLKAEYRIGTDKARTLRDAVAEARTEPGSTDQPPTEQDGPGTGERINGNLPDLTEETVPASPVGPSTVDTDAVSVLGSPLASTIEHTGHEPAPVVPAVARRARSWPVLLLALPAFVAIWSGWVGLGELAGFGVVHPLPGIADGVRLNTAITLPIGVETYAAYALHVWLAGAAGRTARRFGKWSAIGSLLLGMAGQGAYHLMTAYGMTRAPWPVVTLVSCLPVAVLGMGAALAHLIHDTGR